MVSRNRTEIHQTWGLLVSRALYVHRRRDSLYYGTEAYQQEAVTSSQIYMFLVVMAIEMAEGAKYTSKQTANSKPVTYKGTECNLVIHSAFAAAACLSVIPSSVSALSIRGYCTCDICKISDPLTFLYYRDYLKGRPQIVIICG